MEKKFDLETKMKRLEEITNAVSSDETSLDTSLSLYAEAQEILKHLEEEIKLAQENIDEIIEK